MANHTGKVFNRNVSITGGGALWVGGIEVIAPDGTINVDVPVVTTDLTATGNTVLGDNVADTLAVTGASTITSTSASALTVGANGATNPVLKVAASASSVATGVSITGAAAAGNAAIAAISSATDESLSIAAKGAGVILNRSQVTVKQGAPTAKTVSATLTAAEIAAGIITVNQAGAAASAQQLPLASAMDTAYPAMAAGDAIDFSVINTSTVDAEDASVTTNTGWTLVGSMDVLAYSAAGTASSARFRARKTGTALWTLYRIS